MDFKTVKLYKVLVDGKSCHGGNMTYSLPKGKKPGKWHKHTGKLSICKSGFHLTWNPAHWWKKDAECYEVEAKVFGECTEDDCKVVVGEVRLIKKLTEKDLEQFQIFYSGKHEVKSGKAIACSTSQVTAWNSSQVTAYNESLVTAYNSSQVTAYGNSQVTANGNSRVTACDSSKVTAYDSSQVTCRYGLPSIKLESDNSIFLDYRTIPVGIITRYSKLQ